MPIYEEVELENYGFCESSCVFTNDLTPRINLPKRKEGYSKAQIKHDAILGVNFTAVFGHAIGAYAHLALWTLVAKNAVAA